jgi:uncharacterized glyoxalase superfamily protein PhnB
VQRITPMLSYEDAGAAIEWLTEAFGFVENGKERRTAGERVTHAEMSLDGATIMLATPSAEYRSPLAHRGECDIARRAADNPWVIDGNFVVVDDLDAHYERARKAGANIIREPDNPGVGFRVYTAEDLEGHRWMFGEPAP